MDFKKGDRVRVAGERGTYKVQRDSNDKDGSLLLYGGDTNPNGSQGFRSVMPGRLSIDKRRAEKGS